MDKKAKKKYYCKNTNIKAQRKDDLMDTMTGVFMTTDKNKEKTCVKDAYNILNEAVENNYPGIIEKLKQNNLERKLKLAKENTLTIEAGNNNPIQTQDDKLQEIKTTNENSVVNQQIITPQLSNLEITKSQNISDMLENELKSLRKNQDRLFFNFDTNCKGVIFLRIDRDMKDTLNIKKIVFSIVEKTYKTKEQMSKAIARFIPIELAMKANFELFMKHAPNVINKYFNVVDENIGKNWKLDIKIRNNNSMHKNTFFDYIIGLIDRSKHPVEYKNPDFTILLEISNDLLCFTVLEKYYQYKLYNLLSLSKSEEELRLEREKLINLQNTAHERKGQSINTLPKNNSIDVNESYNPADEINLSLNESNLNEKVENKDNEEEKSEEDNSDIDLI